MKMLKPKTQKDMLTAMEQDFKITRKIFLNIKTGWFDRSKNKDNLVSAKDITIPQIQGRYRLNLDDNNERIQEFFFDLEWSSFTEEGKPLSLITKEIVNDYYPKLKKASEILLNLILKYIPKDVIYIKASGSGLHIQFFLQDLEEKDQWHQITRYFIDKTHLPNTKHAGELVFGLDSDTIMSSDRKIAEFGSWNKLKRDLKKEVTYLNYAQWLTVDQFILSEHYPFCPDWKLVNYPRYQFFPIPKNLLDDASKVEINEPVNNLPPVKELRPAKSCMPVSYDDQEIPIKKCPAYWSIIRKTDTEWYERHFLVKFLKYAFGMSMKEILDLFDKYACWSDYKPSTTRYYVKKHFRNGTCETKVRKPPKKKTLIKYNLCIDKCNECVYSKKDFLH
jgi:hypothetical protein